MSLSEEDLYGEVGRKECPIEECGGERVRHQSTDVPLGCTTMRCTGECGAYETIDGRREYGSVSQDEPAVPDDDEKHAYSCPNDECEEVVSACFGCTVESMPHDAPDDIEKVTFHSCAECDTGFEVGKTESGDRRVIDIDDK